MNSSPQSSMIQISQSPDSTFQTTDSPGPIMSLPRSSSPQSSSELGDKLRQMAKFRNRLVHLYGEIDNTNVYEYIKGDLKDIEEFKSVIIKRHNI